AGPHRHPDLLGQRRRAAPRLRDGIRADPDAGPAAPGADGQGRCRHALHAADGECPSATLDLCPRRARRPPRGRERRRGGGGRMRRVLPHPLLVLSLIFVWLLLTRFSLGHLVLGTVIATFAGWAFARIEPDPPRIRAYLPLIRLA